MLDDPEVVRESVFSREAHSRGLAWMRTLSDNQDIPQSHWRKEHDGLVWKWIALKTCHYWNCTACNPEANHESN